MLAFPFPVYKTTFNSKTCLSEVNPSEFVLNIDIIMIKLPENYERNSIIESILDK